MRMGAFAGRRGGGVPDPSLERSERDVYRSVVLRLAGLTALLLILSQGVLSFLLARTFEDTLLPEVRRKAEVAGELVAEQIGYAVSLGIPLRSLVEMDEYLDGVLADNEDFRYVAVLDPNDVELYARGTLSESTRDAADAELDGADRARRTGGGSRPCGYRSRRGRCAPSWRPCGWTSAPSCWSPC